MTPRPLLLASSSPYRKALLQRLELPFTTASPDIDESPEPGESAGHLAVRLARQKAEALAADHRGHWIIGSDQVACLADGTLLSKPGDHERAVRQLARSSGQQVSFLTGLALLDSETGAIQTHCEPFEVRFRTLTTDDIEHYLTREQPYDCAGSFKMEGLGIALFESLSGRDPNSLVGLPLIALTDMLRNWGLNPLRQP
ncbi:septum formation inhibitor Maf [Marinobacter lipolyticus]|uniref:Maf family protein n=1 Tax=Marinobacter lipolyticus TaxID=209639 RepID=UPI001BCDD60C|nr:Maf family nucleotide pyrophosphatase [Marinobacter lipolyticus]MBS8241830.1 septum formation inhibitor Maf [Marinobacter lipolyticus]